MILGLQSSGLVIRRKTNSPLVVYTTQNHHTALPKAGKRGLRHGIRHPSGDNAEVYHIRSLSSQNPSCNW